jgi:hypothetical protein
MCWLTRIVLAAAIMSLVGHACLAGEPDAAALADLIDRHIETRLEHENLRPAARADDSEFLRRVYLDLHGVVPSADEAARFLDDTAPEKRARLIDKLLARPRYGEYFADIWRGRLISPLFEVRGKPEQFQAWLADRFNRSTWDRIVTDLLTATGTMEENPAVTYLIEGRHPRGVADLADLSSRCFLGIRLNCAQCHDHPFVELTREDFWGMAAFFTQIQTPDRPKTVYRFGVRDNPQITLASLQDANVMDGILACPPTYLGAGEVEADHAQPPRRALAEWMTSPDNPYFARAMVNRMWQHFFSRGIVDPVDDMHSAHPPSHPELLELLSRRFVESGFDLKFLCRAIVLSRAYQRTSRPGDAPQRQAALFGRMSVKVLSAGQLYDSLVAVFGPPSREKGVNVSAGVRQEFTEFFAEQGADDPTNYGRGIPHALRLMSARQFAGQNLSALVSRLATSGRSSDEVAGDLFLTILSRRPTGEERQRLRNHVRDSDSPETAYRELAWALMMTSEFSLNH